MESDDQCGAGAWLMAAPTLFGYFGLPRIHNQVIGLMIVSFSIVWFLGLSRLLRWGILALGLLLVISPSLFRYRGYPMLTSNLTGVLVALCSLVERPEGHMRMKGGGSFLRR